MEERGDLGELPEDLMSERAIRDPILSPLISHFTPGQTIGPVGAPQNFPVFGTETGFVNRYKYAPYPFLAQLAAQKIITANNRRVYLLIQNKSTGSMFVNFGTIASAFNSFTLVAGASIEFIGGEKGGAFCPADDVYVLGTVANQSGMASEGSLSIS
jgi:hypothetical protein